MRKNYTKNFSKLEFLVSKSHPYLVKSIVISREQDNNIMFLCNSIMQPLRDLLRIPIIITSGFRSRDLNRAVGGVFNSDHLIGIACDFKIPHNEDLFHVFTHISKNVEYRQVIFYPYKDVSKRFIHVSVNIPGITYKRESLIFTGDKDAAYLPYETNDIKYI